MSAQVEGNKERVIVPVELRIGKYQDALAWNEWNASGTGLLKSSDIYHQGIARDEVKRSASFSSLLESHANFSVESHALNHMPHGPGATSCTRYAFSPSFRVMILACLFLILSETPAVLAQPSGWEYFSAADKTDYLAQYAIGREYECWSRPSTGFHEVTFRSDEKSMHRLIPQVKLSEYRMCGMILSDHVIEVRLFEYHLVEVKHAFAAIFSLHDAR